MIESSPSTPPLPTQPMTSADIPGWSDFVHIYLFMYAIAAPESRFVEVGCCFGSSAAYMGELIRNGDKRVEFTTVDVFDLSLCEPGIAEFVQEECQRAGKPDWQSLVNHFLEQCGVKDHVRVAKSDSVAMSRTFADASLDFVFIDGDHSYPAVCADIDAWLPKIKPGGWIGGHDYDRIGVERAVLERFDRREVLNIPPRSWLVQTAGPTHSELAAAEAHSSGVAP